MSPFSSLAALPPLSGEWLWWCLMNGVPALVATIAFLAYPPFDRFAWNVEDRRSGIFFATAFLFRAALFVHIVTAQNWGEVRWMTIGNAVFAAVLLGVTLVWGDRFHWSRPVAIIWLYLYIEEPVWMLTLAPRAAAEFGANVAPGAALAPFTQLVLWLEAALLLVVGVLLWVSHRSERTILPWTPDLVSARIMSGFALGWTAWAATLALAPTWTEARGGVVLNMVWLGATFLAVLVFAARFDLRLRRTQAYLLFTGGFTALLAVAYFLQGG